MTDDKKLIIQLFNNGSANGQHEGIGGDVDEITVSISPKVYRYLKVILPIAIIH